MVEGEFVKNRNVCFTGHRKIPSDQINDIVRQLKNIIVELINNSYTDFYAGGALGFDTIAAQTILKLKASYPYIKLILVLPCVTQSKGWKNKDIEIYENIKNHADKIVYTSEDYTRGCMHKRNRHLVAHSSACICYLRNDIGGTAYTVEYAKKQGLKILNIALK